MVPAPVSLQALSFHRVRGNVHRGFQDIMGTMNKPGNQYQLKIANRLFGAKTYEFLSVSAIVYALRRGKQGRGQLVRVRGRASPYAWEHLGT